MREKTVIAKANSSIGKAYGAFVCRLPHQCLTLEAILITFGLTTFIAGR